MQIFVTATNTGVGKTYTTLQLMEISHKMGLKPGAIKPIETGVHGIPEDGSKLLQKCQELNPNLKDVAIDDIVPYQFSLPAAPYVAKKDRTIDLEYIRKKINMMYEASDILFIEGAGGLMVPIEKDFFMIDLIKFLDTPALLVTPSKLGCINDTLLSLNLLNNSKIAHQWYINLHEDKDDFFEITYPFYKAYFDEVPLELSSVLQRYSHSYSS
ncbi:MULTISPECIES: dethiobiotin synthase [unclassified Nitratiruptor]|uniref:dethiobiotin synthase n=1 Tax=unclassified Nitratiruptor TaxID=2624044 RepID=UPI001915E660|nr:MULTISPECIES: dethiobiotin synthase [unclassified Nitratiruptor]BCD59715.1 dethiobiotin synthetase [Nitratiruptor sp. YY08-10]BCD63639.1 dethiobiotin synthetase [Nitratiruptor sp. YY08-14]